MAKRGGRKLAEKLAQDLHHYGVHIPGDVALAMVRQKGWVKDKESPKQDLSYLSSTQNKPSFGPGQTVTPEMIGLAIQRSTKSYLR